MSTSLILVTAILASLSFLLVKHVQRPKKPPLPPGPKGLPLLGNIRDLPPPGTLEWPHWQSHKEKYGPITSVSVLGQHFVLLHDKQVIMDLLETRAMKSASRPKLVFAGDIVGYDGVMGLMPYNRTFRMHRKLTATQVSPKSITRFEAIQEQEIVRLLKKLHQDPDSHNLPDHLNQVSGSIMLRILYNYETDPQRNDHIVTMANLVMEEFSQATTPGAWMVDFIPWLRYIPEWVPGAGFKRTAKLFRQHLLQNVQDPYQYVKDQMANGKDDVSYVAGLIKDIHRKIDPEEESVIAWTAASMMNAGTDTSGATLLAFFTAMLIYPNIQKKAQEEIDRVIGDSHLPSFTNKPNLPYITAIAQEVLRWHTLAPMGFPHMTTEDDTYRGYFIPKNTLLFPAVASLTHDPEVYHDPMEFKPERYFEPYNEPLPTDLVFGFGRRACPGRWIADQTLFLSIAQTLAVFRIEKEVDGEGREVEVGYEQLPGVISRVKPFTCRIVLRSEKYRKFVE
ncbi:O-methylsterigmatocystin oxidoreductase [Fusarium acutatum]|uniref:O-methylsterigmatocystin oxidoreductase n=1 Tax=Fusarium acutatum TaxID=78861 RepID=A0A8H4JH70_9HYPO|nr:O-methylsterigmatocystin oxidoreductase [Fusarium acutatum]